MGGASQTTTTNISYLLRGEADGGSVGRSWGSDSTAGDISGAEGLFSFALGIAGWR